MSTSQILTDAHRSYHFARPLSLVPVRFDLDSICAQPAPTEAIVYSHNSLQTHAYKLNQERLISPRHHGFVAIASPFQISTCMPHPRGHAAHSELLRPKKLQARRGPNALHRRLQHAPLLVQVRLEVSTQIRLHAMVAFQDEALRGFIPGIDASAPWRVFGSV